MNYNKKDVEDCREAVSKQLHFLYPPVGYFHLWRIHDMLGSVPTRRGVVLNFVRNIVCVTVVAVVAYSTGYSHGQEVNKPVIAVTSRHDGPIIPN